MKKGWIQANQNGAYENLAPNTLADQVYMDETQTQTIKQALQNAGGGAQELKGSTTYENTCLGVGIGDQMPINGMMNTMVGTFAAEGVSFAEGTVCVGAHAGMAERMFVPEKHIMDSVYIGRRAMPIEYEHGSFNEVVIGANSRGGGSDTVTLGNEMTRQLYCQSPVITMLSDRRVKEDIAPADVGMCLEAVKQLPVTRYKYKSFTGRHVDTHVTGFLADDVEQVFPKSVTKADKYFPVLDENDQPVYEETENGHRVQKMFLMENVKDLTMTEAVPTLWGALQAVLARVEALESK